MKMNDNEKFTLKFDPKRLLLNPGFFTVSPVAKYRITIESDGDTTTAKMIVNGKEVKTTTAKRNPADKANWRIGAQTAFDRMWAKQEKPEKEKEYGGFKVGDRVVIVSLDPKVYGKHGTIVAFDNVCNWFCVELDERVYNHNCDGKTKAGHGCYALIKHLTHEQPTKQKVREVKRKAKTGEYIKFIKPFGGIVKPGDIAKVNFVYETGALTVQERDLPHKSGCEVDEHFNWYVPLCTYVVLEGYKPGRDA